MFTAELDVLKPIDPSITNPDDYEIFALSNAQVVYASNGRPASLLAAYADIPLRVEGRLETPSRAQMKYLVQKPFKPIDIEIRGVTRYSYGQTTDGDMMIWALGKAGWFEIQPSRSYKVLYQDMVQAVEILYFVTDIYNEPRKRGGGPSAELIFQEYAEDPRFTCNTHEEAAEIFYKHRAFLIMCFLNRAQGLGWSNTPLYQFFRRRFSKEFEAAKARIEGKYATKPENPVKADSVVTVKTRAKGKENGKPKTKSSDAPRKDNNWWESAAIFEFMQKAVNQGAMHKGNVTIERVAKLLVKRYELEQVEIACNVILVHAQNLCYMMAHPRRKNIEYFANEPIYHELCSGHNLSAAEVRRTEGIELRPRKDHGRLTEEVSSSEEESSDEAEAATPRQRLSGKQKGRLSVLRPRSSKYSGKGNGKGVKRGKGKGKKNVPILTDDDDEDNDSEDESSDALIDTPTQTLSPGKRKRIADPTSDARPRKRPASHSLSPKSSPSSPSSSSLATDTDAVASPALPLRWRDTNSSKAASPALLPPIVSTPLPTYTANGPKDSWVCTFDGCSQRIYGASTEFGTGLIHEHLQDHGRGRAFEIGLVMSEEQKLRLPVNNLIKRIREMAERQQPLFPTTTTAGGTALRPTPIERTV
ncbi:hypothetical protein K505DRAFT_323629 [Melanomma pulvis-pyrius CBS 109.77]|uniref:DNA (cytosine-5)-methyltransferase 1 replication foci domain-containing protein n=1 Tax=Melanomma pulvis-pyrius CBS 109.77 TaxID=1314802 RepID=A0A6A6XKE7_9PLEO|nr:hypothetical protein K505DRAFT_323629 [Melanomma pulvis-pyrius CBS 109.77]